MKIASAMRRTFNLFLLLCITFSYSARVKSDDIPRPIIRTVWKGGEHSEGPHWSATENVLYWVDISAQNVHRLEPATNTVTSRHIEYGPVSPIIPIKEAPGKVVLGVRSEIYTFNFNTSQEIGDDGLRMITALDLGRPDNRVNDGKCDAAGRFWVGTMGNELNENVDPDQAAFYLITQNNYINPEIKVRPVSVSNGLAWSKDNKYLFYIDTPTLKVDVFDFNLDTGSIKNRRTIFDLAANKVSGYPDGMTIDTEDNLWIALYNGGKVIKVDSRSGRLLEEHNIPAKKVTSVMWGGDNLSTLYVTTSKRGLTSTELAEQPLAGSVFAIEGTGSQGFPANEFVFDPNF